jgi:hypothetical protein
MKTFGILRTAVVAALLLAPLAAARAASEQQSLEELRNTVINLLQALVEQGVVSRDKAQALVKQAQDKAASDAALTAKSDAGAIRVPYVPELVREQIRKEVAADLQPQVVESVVARARDERWGVPGALPDWLGRLRLTGELTLRGEADLYARDNVRQVYLNYQAINQAGSVAGAGLNAFTNVTEDRDRLRVRARFGVQSQLSPAVSAAIRIVTGNPLDPSSEYQTLGNYSQRYGVQLDQAWLRWEGRGGSGGSEVPWLTTIGGRMPNPWFSPTNLVYYQELQVEGLAATGRLRLAGHGPEASQAFLTLGVLPVQEVALSARDKWLLGAQLGTSLRLGMDERLRLALAFYDFEHVQGLPNAAASPHQYDFTAPPWLQQGNSVYNIAYNPAGGSSTLYALASKFRLVNLSAAYEVPVGSYSIGVRADAVRNVGFDAAQILALTGQSVEKRNKGYQADLSFGHPTLGALGRWRATLGYRYLQRDAVLDAWTDTDFHEGGTDTKGYYFVGDLGIGPRTWLRLRYLSANEIDGPTGLAGLGQLRYGVDVLQFDVNASF